MKAFSKWAIPLVLLIAIAFYATGFISIFNNRAKVESSKDNSYMILIDIDEFTLYLIDARSNRIVKSYPIAVGKPETPSPVGSFKIVHKDSWGGGFGTRWMGLNVPFGQYGIHGTNKPGSIGWAASHGCFRMRNADVEDLYSRVDLGTVVVIVGGPYGPLGHGYKEFGPGDRNSAIMQVQIRLKRLGYYKGPIDGIYEDDLKEALLRFKKDKKIPYNHFIDEDTYKALNIIPYE
ncbi:L,D-transpeptidase family protein [Caldanaerobius polysaccharolyticus]|uniref:L,D-transpeptidase family protein n=1 Tax=Caldanaerobius polysaccharolyticus TaxID=44256 RepID=UPI00047C4053|nr:L,D-transpeptidase family protein [Caldanaerobius polysaccharolyticus]